MDLFLGNTVSDYSKAKYKITLIFLNKNKFFTELPGVYSDLIHVTSHQIILQRTKNLIKVFVIIKVYDNNIC